MSKILVTNLQETLIPFSEESCNTFYGIDDFNRCKKRIYESLKKELEAYLKEGNKLTIVATPDENLVKTLITDVYNTLKEYNELIDIYINDKGSNTTISNSKKITFIENKEDIFDYIDPSLELYCLGTDHTDIGMLNKALSLNGKSSLICHKLLNPCFINNDRFLTGLINERINAIAENEIQQQTKISQVAKVQLQKRLWLNNFEPQKKGLQNSLFNGEITYIDIIKEWYIRQQIELYHTFNKQIKPSLERTNNLVSDISVYNSFNEYNKLVLKPSKNTK